MSGNWYDINWKMRRPVAVSVLGGGGAGTYDVEIDIPKDWDDFWDNVKSDMFDVVPVNNTGGLLTFQRKAGASYATRTLSLQLESAAITNSDAISHIYIYWMNPSATDQATGPHTITSPKVGTLFLGAPTGRIVQTLPNRAATEAPQTSFTKTTNEQVDVWFSINTLLMQRLSTYKTRKGFEAINYVQVRSLDTAGADDAGRYDEGETRFIPGWVKVRSKGGSNNTDYTLELLIYTTTQQTFSLRCLIKVRDLLPT